MYLPFNTSSVVEPCDQGIIWSLKSAFRRSILEWQYSKWKELKPLLDAQRRGINPVTTQAAPITGNGQLVIAQAAPATGSGQLVTARATPTSGSGQPVIAQAAAARGSGQWAASHCSGFQARFTASLSYRGHHK